MLPFSAPCQKQRPRSSTPTTGRMTSTELHIFPLLAFQLCHGRLGPSCGAAEHMQDIFEKARAAPCCEVFAKHDLRALWLLLEEVVNPFKYSHCSIIKKFKSKDDTLAWHVDMALGNWTRVLLRATSGLANRQLFVQAGLTRWSFASPAIVSFDDETSGKIARAVVNFWSHYVADEIRTNRRTIQRKWLRSS